MANLLGMMKWIVLVFACGVVGNTGYAQQLSVKKFTPALTMHLAQAVRSGATDSVDLVVQWKGAPVVAGHRQLRAYGPDLAVVRVAATVLHTWVQQESLVFAGLSNTPVPELTTGSMDNTLNRVNAAHTLFPGIKGAGVHLSIKEQRFDTADIDIRGRVLPSGLEAVTTTTHASIMATIAAGGANTSQEAIGAAPAVMVSSASFSTLLPDPDTALQKLGVSVQNHSYGTVVENFYGAEALAYDRQSVTLPNLLHVFSAGNTGQASGTGPYNGLAARANLSGNFKQAKNVLTVGALDYEGKLLDLSAKGPAFDGRLKPELVAFGQDGTSGAAALVSGTAALLQDAYRQANGRAASSALLRAVLLSTAVDVGTPGPDYQSGWGSMDALAALQTINENRYRTVPVAKGQVTQISIVIPPGIRQFKATLSWTDSAAAANSGKALRNDLDLVLVRETTGERWLPWVLNPQPVLIDAPARRGVDTLNNNEQVTLDNPSAGTYWLQIDGSRLGAAQEAALAWQLDTAGVFAFTAPLNGAGLLAGQDTYIRWRGQLPPGGIIEFTTDGNSWQPVGTSGAGAYHALWQVPTTVGWARLRMQAGGNRVLSDSFAISSRPNVQVGFLCGDSVLLHWPALAPAYRLYQLGSRYLEPVRELSDTFAIVQLDAGSSGIFSVAPVFNQKEGVRSFAFNSREAGVGCYFKSFFVQGQTPGQVQLQATLGTLLGVQNLRLQKKTGSQYQDAGAALGARIAYTITDAQPRKGFNFYRLVLGLNNGREVYSEPLAVFHFGNQPVQAYPNPVRSGSVLRLQSSLPGKYQVQVYDMYGQPVQRLQLRDVATPVSVHWPAGVYFLKITSDEGLVETARVVVL